MKCSNCGYDNDINLSNCIKCNTPLTTTEKEFSASKTVLGRQASSYDYLDNPELSNTKTKTCENCGYQVMGHAMICPNCNSKIGEKSQKKELVNHKSTIDPYRHANGFKLTPIVNGEPSKNVLTFEGNADLNRANTVDSATITSKTQASISLQDGEWYLEDKSEKKNTFLQANKPLKLTKGDIILLGDTKFIFE